MTRTRKLSVLVALAIAAFLPPSAEAQAKRDTIPFVGCPADGQAGSIEPPAGAPKIVALGDASAREIAYYKGAQARGVFAPRGWHCRVWYGSSGSALVVSPVSIDSPYFPPPKFRGQAVEMQGILGGTSGRFGVARYASRLFPQVAAR